MEGKGSLVSSDTVKLALSDKQGDAMATWTKWRGRLFIIEIYMSLFILQFLTSSQLIQQNIFQKFARETLSETHNYTAPNHSICLKQDYIVSATGNNDSIIEIQKRANNLAMYLEVIGLCASGVMALFYGSLSDIIGRKPILTVALIGMTIMCAIQFAVIEFDLNNYSIWLIVAAGINGFLGGTATMLGISFASVSDVTSRKWRTLRLGTTESSIGFGKAASYTVVYYWINSNGCDFKGPAYTLIGIVPLTFIYLILLPESLPPKERRQNGGGFKKIANGIKVFIDPSRTGLSKWWRIWDCVAIVSIECLCVIGVYQVINYFLHNEPLQWSYELIGIYGVVTALSTVVSLVIVLPLMIALPIPRQYMNPSFILLASVIAVVTNIMMATVKHGQDWEMFLAGTVQTLQMIAFPSVRAILSGLVDAEDYGAVLSITASIQMFGSAGSTVLFNEIYRPEAEVNGHHYNAGIIFWITAGFWASLIPLILLLFKKQGETKTESVKLLTGSQDQYHTIQ